MRFLYYIDIGARSLYIFLWETVVNQSEIAYHHEKKSADTDIVMRTSAVDLKKLDAAASPEHFLETVRDTLHAQETNSRRLVEVMDLIIDTAGKFGGETGTDLRMKLLRLQDRFHQVTFGNDGERNHYINKVLFS